MVLSGETLVFGFMNVLPSMPVCRKIKQENKACAGTGCRSYLILNKNKEPAMTIEQTFATALEYEQRIRDLYVRAAAAALLPEAKAFYEALAVDEASHVAYLEHKLADWRTTGAFSDSAPASTLPQASELIAAIGRVKAGLSGPVEGGKPGALADALKAEEETSAFYRSMVGELPDGARQIFARLLAIEDGHTAIVRAELDLVMGTGHWFDVREFDMEE